MTLQFGPRRGVFIDLAEQTGGGELPLSTEELERFEQFDAIYRWLVALMFNYVPTSGHPGGSISSGRIVTALLYDAMDYDLSDPHRDDADIISYSAGHKALGLYGLWALRNEIARQGAPQLLPEDEGLQLRLEDLLGFRRNPVSDTPLFLEFKVKPLDGHPTPATPFVKLSTGASGVGVASSLGLAFGAADAYGALAPKVHIIEGEGGLTPGRVAESLAAAGTASLGNAVMHVDWNQASIDSDHVCRTDGQPGDYVQWDPMELFYLHDWNVIHVPDGKDFQQIVAAQRLASTFDNGQPTAVIYRTIKGWRYGIEGRGSHGAGHKLCSGGYFEVVDGLEADSKTLLPKCPENEQRCHGGKNRAVVEECYWAALQLIRAEFTKHQEVVECFAGRLKEARGRLDTKARRPREGAPEVEKIFSAAAAATGTPPGDVAIAPGGKTTLRGELGRVLGHLNRLSGGAVLSSAADLLGSTSVIMAADGFPEGFFNTAENPEGRLLSIGGICEDAMCGILAGLATYGYHLGAGSSYGAFISPLGHIAARLHAIGNQARQQLGSEPFRPFFLICAHAGLKTGEDGPTHADPQPLQLLQGNFPAGTLITLTPWDPQEMWSLVTSALAARPAVIAPFVTRPAEAVLDREQLGLAPASAAASGLYALRRARNGGDGSVVLQGSGVTYAFVEQALPLIDREGLDLNVYYVASAELFDALSAEEQESIFPAAAADSAMGITGFTLPTMYRWVRSDHGRKMSLYPFKKGEFLGSGQGDMVLAEAGLDGESQFRQILRYVNERG